MTSDEHESEDLLVPGQCRAARALLGWSQADLARQASVGQSTVADFERGHRSPVPNNLESMKEALERGGALIRGGGVVPASAPRPFRTRSNVPADKLRPIRWVDESDLGQWSDRRDGQDTLPELVRRLIIAEQGYLPDLRFPSKDSVYLHGWDGQCRTDRSSDHVPSGWSGWELGVDRQVGQKAAKAYAARVNAPVPNDANFVFVTPRRWAGKDKWVSDRQAEGKWVQVRAFDAVDLVQWIEQFPGIGLWLRGQINRTRLEGVRELQEAWLDWSHATRLPLTEGLVLAGRDEEAARIWCWLHAGPAILAIEAEAPAEAIAVLHAAISQLPPDYRDFYRGKSVVVADPEVARRLADVPTRLIVVLEQPEPGLALRLVEKGHHVFLPFGSAPGGGDGDVLKLARPPRYELEEHLAQMGMSSVEAQQCAKDAARSLTVLRRLMPAAPGYKIPEWAQAETGRLLLAAVFAGAWDERQEADKEALSHLAGIPCGKLMERLSALLPISDSPLRKVGPIWKIASPRDAWFRLAPFVCNEDMERFAEVAGNVLGSRDPRFEMTGDERMYAGVDGQLPRHSSYLRSGIAEALVVLGVFGERANVVPNARVRAGIIVRSLLGGATEERWWSLSDELRELGEAAPGIFLDCIEDSLAEKDPAVAVLFKEDEGGLFGRAYHAGLLWALETLAWSRDYLPKVMDVLARLATIDPGGSWSNRPARSLRQIFLLWRPQTNVRLDERLKILGRLRQTNSKAAWALFLDLYPKSHEMAHDSPVPRWRDFSGDVPEVVTRQIIYRGAEQLGAWLLEDAGADVDRWTELTERYPDLSPELRAALIARASDLPGQIGDDEQRTRLQGAMRSVISHHRKYGTTNWALPEEDLGALEGVYDALEPVDPVQKVVWLFDEEEAALVHPEGHDWEANRQLSLEERKKAVKALHRKGGMKRIKALVQSARRAALVGDAFALTANIDVVEKALAEAIRSDDQKEQDFARGIVWTCSRLYGEEWSKRLIDKALKERWGDEAIARMLLSLGAVDDAMKYAAEIGGEAEKLFWSRTSVYVLPDDGSEMTQWVLERLLDHGRARDAIKLAGHAAGRIDDELLLRILEEGVHPGSEDAQEPAMFRYYVERIFQKLDNSDGLDPDRLAKLEWIYLNVLEGSGRPPITLHRQLATSPSFFVEVLSAVYRSSTEQENTEDEADREQKAAIASHAWTLLQSWHQVPGEKNGEVDGPVLEAWVKEARRLCEEIGRTDIGDEKIGEMLAWAPADKDGIWPCEPVREVIEITRSRHLETGLYIGAKNKRGVTSRGVFDGGELERDLVIRYRGYADAVRLEWQRVAAVLDRIADSYDAEAQEHDDDVERRQW